MDRSGGGRGGEGGEGGKGKGGGYHVSEMSSKYISWLNSPCIHTKPFL